MSFARWRTAAALAAALFLLLLGASRGHTQAAPDNGTVPGPVPNRLTNGEFECDDGGYYVAQNGRGEDILLPNKWTLTANGEIPILSSARIWFEGSDGSCDTNDNHVEKISGRDSVFVSSLDIETLPEPGKPFDVAIYQQIPAISGTAYSLSGWQLTLCGGSNVPNDCPDGVYMAKMLGIDPTGGVDINSPDVVWGENRNNFVDKQNKRIGWANVRATTTAQSGIITVFARINSPFRWHGNHGFIDALSLVQAPISTLHAVTSTLTETQRISVTLAWDGSLGDDIPTIIGGNFELLYDVQYWHPDNNQWRDLAKDHGGAGSVNFLPRCTGEDYLFRVRVRAEQPHGTGVSPNQRYPGLWSKPLHVPVPDEIVITPPPPEGDENIYMPLISAPGESGC